MLPRVFIAPMKGDDNAPSTARTDHCEQFSYPVRQKQQHQEERAMQPIKMQPNNWRAIKGNRVFAGGSSPVGFVRESACAPDEYFWTNQHPLLGQRGNQPDDVAVPGAAIADASGGRIRLSITRRELLALPQRWQGEIPVFDMQPQTAMERFAAGFRYGRRLGEPDIEPPAMDRFSEEFQYGQRMDEPEIAPVQPVADKPRTTVRSALEDGIAELEAIERRRMNLLVEYGTIPPEMDELFTAHRKQVKDRRLAQLERELSEMIGLEKDND